MELLEYWRREAEVRNKAIKKARGKQKAERDDVELPEWQPPDEATAEAMFHAFPKAGPLPGQVGVDPNISRMGPEQRAMAQWAEEMKEKHKLN